jgi:hypothetical protein
MGNFGDLLRRYYPFTKDELTGIVVSILALTLIVAFNDKSESFEAMHWLGNFLMWLVIVSVSFLIHQTGHRLAGIKMGYRVEYQMWWYGLLTGLVVMLVTRGKIWILVPGGIWIHQLAVQRLGRFRYGPNVQSLAMVALCGPLASILFGGLIKTVQVWFGFSLFGEVFVHNLFVFNMALAAYSLLPIPPLAGSRLLFHSRLSYAFVAGTVVGYAVLIWLGVYSYIFALLIGIIVWLVYYLAFEKGAWKF